MTYEIVYLVEYIFWAIPAGIYLLKDNNRNTRTRCEICSKLTISTVSIVNLEHVIADRDNSLDYKTWSTNSYNQEQYFGNILNDLEDCVNFHALFIFLSYNLLEVLNN